MLHYLCTYVVVICATEYDIVNLIKNMNNIIRTNLLHKERREIERYRYRYRERGEEREGEREKWDRGKRGV